MTGKRLPFKEADAAGSDARSAGRAGAFAGDFSRRRWLGACAGSAALAAGHPAMLPATGSAPRQRLLYVASPGIRNYLQYGGHGLLVFDMDRQYALVKRIPLGGLGPDGKPLNVKGICGHAGSGRLYVSTIRHLMCVDLASEQMRWERTYPLGCDRMAIRPDGRIIYLPSYEKDRWYVVRAEDGEVVHEIVTGSGSHNTVMGPDGRYVYLAGLRSPWLAVVDTQTHQIVRRVGPFSASIRPFTVDGAQRYCFVNVNGLLGFEVGDLRSGKVLHRVQVEGFGPGPVKRHGCPSHGIGLTPDGRELWVCDAANQRMHLFDATVMPPRQIDSIALRDQPGWITFSIDGHHAWPSTGDVVERASRRIVARLSDEEGRQVQSEKLLEVDLVDGKPVAVGDQFGVGRATQEVESR